jgi:hypothetical protein
VQIKIVILKQKILKSAIYSFQPEDFMTAFNKSDANYSKEETNFQKFFIFIKSLREYHRIE